MALLVVSLPVASAAFEDRQSDEAGDVFVSGNAPELPHLDIRNVTGTLDGAVFDATLSLGDAPRGIDANDSLNYQVLLDVREGTTDGFPPDSGWDASVVCRHLDGIRPDTCALHGANGSVQQAGFQGHDLVLEVVFEAGFQATDLTLGAGAAQQRQAGEHGFTAYDFTPNADIERYLTGTPGTDPGGQDPPDDGPPWLGIGLGALAGIALGAWWARRRKR